MPPARAIAIQEGKGNGRPSRPPWVIRTYPLVIIAAAVTDACELQELRAPPSRDNVGGVPLFERGSKFAVDAPITALAFARNTLFVGMASGGVMLLDADNDWARIAILAAPSPIVAIAPLPTAPRDVLAADTSGTVRAWRGGRRRRILRGGARVLALAVTERAGDDGTWAAGVAMDDGVVRVVRQDGMCVAVRDAPRYGNARALKWMRESLVIAGEDDTVHVVRDGKLERSMMACADDDGHCSFVTAICTRGDVVVTAGMDGRIVMWKNDGFGDVLFCREGDAFYQMEWTEEDVLFASACVDEKGKCVLYRITLANCSVDIVIE